MSDLVKHQVFVSSTYTDLPEERQAVFTTLLTMDCFPAGMEFFGAVDLEQFELIKTIIDDCDYYLVVIGGRYGTPTADGISFTEKEYDYAISKGLKVIALLHRNPGKIEAEKSELEPEARKRLADFREKLKTGRLVDFWETPGELRGVTALAMVNAKKFHKMPGWVRPGTVSNVEALTENHELRKKLQEAEAKLAEPRSALPIVENLAGLDEAFELKGKYGAGAVAQWAKSFTWHDIAKSVLSILLMPQWDEAVRRRLVRDLFPKAVEEHQQFYADGAELSEGSFDVIRMQLSALGLVIVGRMSTAVPGSAGLAWEATDQGKAFNFLNTVVRTLKTPAK